MKKEALFSFLALALLLIIGFWYFKSYNINTGPSVSNSTEEPTSLKPESSPPNNEAARVWEVAITDSEATPKKLTIKKGDEVVFINKGTQKTWPASDLHPVHNDYPEKGGCLGSAFDACRGLANGESFKFRFNFVGSWLYHDHLNPAIMGTIIVE